MEETEYAFPTVYPCLQRGLTLRDYFAAKAMEAYIHKFSFDKDTREVLSQYCYEMADEMMKQRSANKIVEASPVEKPIL